MSYINLYMIKRDKDVKFDGTMNFYEDLIFVWDEDIPTQMKKIIEAGQEISPFDYLDVFSKIEIINIKLVNPSEQELLNTIFKDLSMNEKLAIISKMTKDKGISTKGMIKNIQFRFNDSVLLMTSRCFQLLNKRDILPFSIKCNELFVEHFYEQGNR